MRLRVCIVGGGASGTLLAIRLLRSHVPVAVTLVERDRSQLARGVAYRDGDDVRPLNVPALGMSAYEEEPRHFVAWLEARALTDPRFRFREDAFVPRAVYGAYLCDELERARHETGQACEIVHDDVVDVVDGGRAYIVRLEAARGPLQADVVVLATGHGSHPTARPFSKNALEGVGERDDVLFVGTGLTTIDHLLALDRRGHKGTSYAVSRRGLWPLSHGTFERTSFSPLTVRAHATTPRTLLRFLRHEAKHGARSWQSVVDALRLYVPSVWGRWGAAERRSFLEHARPYWEIHRHRVPLESQRVLDRLRAEGRLVTLRGHVLSTAEIHGVHRTVVARRGSNESTIIASAAVVRCTGPVSDYATIDHPLVRSLVTRGTLAPDTHRVGVETSFDGRVLARDGSTARALYTLGSPRRAAQYESTGLPEIRRQARALARTIEAHAARTDTRHGLAAFAI